VHIAKLKGFIKEVVDTAQFLVIFNPGPCEHYDRSVGGHALHLRCQFKPIHLRHAEIGKNKRKGLPGEKFERLLSVLRKDYLVPHFGKKKEEHVADAFIVIGNQNALAVSLQSHRLTHLAVSNDWSDLAPSRNDAYSNRSITAFVVGIVIWSNRGKTVFTG